MDVTKIISLVVLVLHLVQGSPILSQKDIQPLHYEVLLRLSENKLSFTGEELISVKASKRSGTIFLKSPGMEISSVVVYDPAKPHYDFVTGFNKEGEDYVQVNLHFQLRENAVYMIKIEFSGRLETEVSYKRLFEKKENGNSFPYLENPSSETTYDMEIGLAQEERQQLKDPAPSTSTSSEATPSTSTSSEATPSTSTSSEATPSTSTSSEATPSTSTSSEATPSTSTSSDSTTQTGTGSDATTQTGTGSDATTQTGTGSDATTQTGTGSDATTQTGTGSDATTQTGTGSDATTQTGTGSDATTQTGTGSDATTQTGTGSDATTQTGTMSSTTEPASTTEESAATCNIVSTTVLSVLAICAISLR